MNAPQVILNAPQIVVVLWWAVLLLVGIVRCSVDEKCTKLKAWISFVVDVIHIWASFAILKWGGFF